MRILDSVFRGLAVLIGILLIPVLTGLCLFGIAGGWCWLALAKGFDIVISDFERPHA